MTHATTCSNDLATATADDDLDWQAFGRDMRERSLERRANNRENSPRLLTAAGLRFASKNAGAHLIVQGLGRTADLWPGTGLWQIRGEKKQHRGVHRLIDHLTPAGDA